jgi:6-phosphogluconolactonase
MKIQRILTALILSIGIAHAASDQLVYIGTYTSGKPGGSKGIHVFGLDSSTGKVEPMGLAAEVKNPSFVAIAPSRKFLYAVSEGSGSEGGVSSFAVDQASGRLTFLNKQSSKGAGPCHVSVDATGKVVLVANYGSGHVASLPVNADGSLGEAASSYLQGPASNATGRQKGPHAHSINPDKGNKFAFACDLGCDKIFIYKMDPATAKLTPNDPPFAEAPAGGGPRHFAFHPGGRFAWANNEITLSVTGYSYNADKGALTPIETVSTLPPGTTSTAGFSTAETQAHPGGKFLYVSNRGHDTIACYTIDQTTGRLTFIEAAPSIVKVPRNFGIDASGKWLIAGGNSGGGIAVFAIDPTTGKLTPTGQQFEVDAAVCVRFLKRD